MTSTPSNFRITRAEQLAALAQLGALRERLLAEHRRREAERAAVAARTTQGDAAHA